MPTLRHARSISAACAVAALAVVGASAPAHAAVPASRHGAAPTAASITQDGVYIVATKRIPANFFGGHAGGTLYYPTGTSGEKFGLVVTMPGYVEPGVTMQTIAKRLASHGFIVMQADTFTLMEQPDSRARIALNALKAAKADATVKPIMDPDRTALIGHSMGGGGVLLAAQYADLDAVVAIHPWAQQGFPEVTEPTMVIGGALDNVAPYTQYTLPIYGSLTQASERSLLTDWAGTHWAGVVDNPAIQGRLLSFIKLTVDGDDRYQQFYCAGAPAGFSFTSATCGAGA